MSNFKIYIREILAIIATITIITVGFHKPGFLLKNEHINERSLVIKPSEECVLGKSKDLNEIKTNCGN